MIDPPVLQIHLEQSALDKPLCTKPSAVHGERKDVFTLAKVRLCVDQGWGALPQGCLPNGSADEREISGFCQGTEGVQHNVWNYTGADTLAYATVC